MAQINDKVVQEIMEVLIQNGVQGGLAFTVQSFINEVMKAQRSDYLQAEPYERSEFRQDYANGFKPKTLHTRMGDLSLKVPQTRNSEFYPSVIEKGLRSERALFVAIAEMYIQGVSTRKVNTILEKLCGCQISSTQVSRIMQLLDEDLKKWRDRPLGASAFAQLVVDARYESVRYGGVVRDLAVVWAIGIRADGKREILGIRVSLSEAEIHWREFFKSLVDRGLHGVSYIVSDDHQGLKAALKTVFPNVAWNRCHTHLARNAQDHVSRKDHKDEVAQDVRDILTASSLQSANALLKEFMTNWQKEEPRLVAWAEANIPEGFAVFELPKCQRKHLRTTNLIERMNQELKRRSRVVRIWPNQESCLRLFSAVLMEVHEEWFIGRRYLPMGEG